MRKLPNNVYTELNLSNIKVADLINLKTIFNGRTIDEMIEIQRSKRPFLCPKCNGKGFNLTEVDLYPSGMPDSGWVSDIQTMKITCGLCDGHGSTSEEFIPKIIEVEYVKK